ncbi:MAG: hypothetical protein NZ522_00280, partial [Chitinophagales bacterium]|nr:hypothetical protein [Chitinophagales bacterium]
IKLTLKSVSFIPKFMIRPLSMLADIITGFKNRNPEFTAYALHNLYHIYRFFARKFGFTVQPATRIVEDISFFEEQQQVESKRA